MEARGIPVLYQVICFSCYYTNRNSGMRKGFGEEKSSRAYTNDGLLGKAEVDRSNRDSCNIK